MNRAKLKEILRSVVVRTIDAFGVRRSDYDSVISLAPIIYQQVMSTGLVPPTFTFQMFRDIIMIEAHKAQKEKGR